MTESGFAHQNGRESGPLSFKNNLFDSGRYNEKSIPAIISLVLDR